MTQIYSFKKDKILAKK